MNRKLKALGLAFMAVFAMGALSAATAGAEQFHVGASHGTIKGTNVGEGTFTTNAGTLRCKTESQEGTFTSSTPSTQTVRMTYTGCTAFGFVNSVIDTGTCEYRYNTPVKTTSTVDIVNCATPITITAFNCWVTVGNQTGLSHVVWSNVAGSSPHDVHETWTVNNTTYTQHSKSFPGCANGTFNNGTVSGTTTWQAFNTEGKQVSLTVT